MVKKKKEKINSYLVFYLEKEMFTIHVNKILSILEMKKITKIPQSPDYMKGVINLRGKVLPIIDSHTKFNLPPATITMKTSIIVLDIKTEGKKIKLGLMVDKVEEVIEIRNKDILPPPNIGNAFQSEYIKGMYKKDEKNFIMIIDIDKVLSLKDVVDLSELKQENIPKELKEEIKIEKEKKQQNKQVKKAKKVETKVNVEEKPTSEKEDTNKSTTQKKNTEILEEKNKEDTKTQKKEIDNKQNVDNNKK